MLEAQGKVIAGDDNAVLIQPENAAGCSDCRQKGICGVGLMAGAGRGGRDDICLPNSLGARAGDRVTIGVSEGAVIRASLWVYGLPLVAMTGSSLCAQQLGAGEPMTIAAGLVGLSGGFFWTRFLARSGGVVDGCPPELVSVGGGKGEGRKAHGNHAGPGDPA